MKFRLPLSAEYGLVAGLGVALLALIAIDAQNVSNPLAALRLILGLLFVLGLPGYYLQLTFFPQQTHLDVSERIVLSLVLSISLIPPLALLLDYLPRGLRLENIVVAQFVLLAMIGALAAVRRLRLPAEERFVIQFIIGKPEWWVDQNQTVKRLVFALIAGLLVVAVASLIIIAAPRPAENFTEFYLLDSRGVAEGFPRNVDVGEPINVTVGIHNHESVTALYRIEVHDGEQLLAQLDPFELLPTQKIEKNLSFILAELGDNFEVRFFLFRDYLNEPYRTLRLWINVR
jgi:uncharacterized membrane protein